MRYALRDGNPWVLGVAATLALALALTLAGLALRVIPTSIGDGRYHAVFLTDGQVYFAKIARETERDLTITDIYYLKLAKPVVTQDDLAAQDATSLVKLGSELHGPEDRMTIPRGQILFLETLKTDGKVAKAIGQYHASGGSGAAN